MMGALKEFGKKAKLKINDKVVWASVSRSPLERKKGKILSKYKRVLIEVGLADADKVRIDYKNGILMINRVRVGVWRAADGDGQMELSQDKLKDAGISVEVGKLADAVTELLSQ